MENQNPNNLNTGQQDTLTSFLTKGFNFCLRRIYNLGGVFAKKFSTDFNYNANNSQRIEFTNKGIYGYDNQGNLIFFYSNDFNNVDPRNTALTLGEGLFISVLQSLTTALTLNSKTGKASLIVSDGNNGQLTFIGDAASGNLQITFSKTVGLTLITNNKGITTDGGLNVTSGVVQLPNAPANITTEVLTKFITFKDSGGNTIKLGVVV